jgi:hypothetical protein
MPPKFSRVHFEFPEDVPVPVHIECPIPISDDEITIPDAYRLEERDSLESDIYIVAADIETLEQAKLLRLARLAFTGEGGSTVINRGFPIFAYSETGQIPINSHDFPELRPNQL